MKALNELMETALTRAVEKIEIEGIVLPEGYSVEGAMREAFEILKELKSKDKKSVTECCTKASIVTALTDMALQGLSPARNQCYFQIIGSSLKLKSSYFGEIAVAKRIAKVIRVNAQCVYRGDAISTYIDEEGIKHLKEHVHNEEETDPRLLIGAYAVVVYYDDDTRCNSFEYMTMPMIRNAWGRETETHRKFPDEMAKKTVMRRALKSFINTQTGVSSETASYIRTVENDDMQAEAENDAISELTKILSISESETKEESEIRSSESELKDAEDISTPEKDECSSVTETADEPDSEVILTLVSEPSDFSRKRLSKVVGHPISQLKDTHLKRLRETDEFWNDLNDDSKEEIIRRIG